MSCGFSLLLVNCHVAPYENCLHGCNYQNCCFMKHDTVRSGSQLQYTASHLEDNLHNYTYLTTLLYSWHTCTEELRWSARFACVAGQSMAKTCKEKQITCFYKYYTTSKISIINVHALANHSQKHTYDNISTSSLPLYLRVRIPVHCLKSAIT
jgi:hypothetical protein